MTLWFAVILFGVCAAGGFLVRRKWQNERRNVFLALWLLLFAASAVLALYGIAAALLLGAV